MATFDLDVTSEYTGRGEEDYKGLLSNFPYRPTLFLGVGGTGGQAVAKTKQLFTKLYGEKKKKTTEATMIGEIPSMYAFLSFDTDVAGKQPNLTKGREFFHLGVKDLGGFYTGIGGGSFFRDWVIKNFPAGSIMAGASGYRNLGRLALMYNITTVRDALSKTLGTITTAHPDLVNPQPVVYLYCSLSGGTGAGMFLDICFLLRKLIPDCHITGLLALLEGLPAMPDIKRKNSNIGTYSALRDLDVFMTGSPREGTRGRIDYPFDVQGTLTEPFDECYIFGNKKADGTISLPTQSHVSSFMTRMTFMMSAYSFPAKVSDDGVTTTPDYAGVMVNHLDDLTNAFEGARASYLVPGMGQFHFPVETIADLFALDATRDYLKYQSSGVEHDGRKEAEELFAATDLSLEKIRDLVSVNPLSPKRELVRLIHYDETVESLFEARYENREQILSLGEKMPHRRVQELEEFLTANVERVEKGGRKWSLVDEKWAVIDRRCRELLVTPGFLGLGALDFLKDLQGMVREELQKVQTRDDADVTPEFRKIQEYWGDIRKPIDDVTLNEGAFDRARDAMNAGKAKDLLIGFLNEAERFVLDKAVLNLTKKVLGDLATRLGDRIGNLSALFNNHVPSAIDFLCEYRLKPLNQLQLQTECRASDVENICSLNVMDEEWRKEYYRRADHLRPEKILDTLLKSGWHPACLTEVVPETGVPVGAALAQAVLNQVGPMLNRERNLTPSDVISISAGLSGRTVQEGMGKSLLAMMQPQMQINGMKNLLNSSPYRILFFGGINSELKEVLQSTPEFGDVEMNLSDNLESRRVNFFSSTLPVALAGCDLVRNALEPVYARWKEDLKKIGSGKEKRTQQEFELRKYNCFPGSSTWPLPTRYQAEIEVEKALFGKALAISLMLEVSPADQEKMKKCSAQPKEKMYGLFQIGRSQFWLWPFFEPGNSASQIKGKPMNLGSNILSAYQAFRDQAEHRDAATAWVAWFEASWSRDFTGTEIGQMIIKAQTEMQDRKGKTSDDEQVAMWDQLIEVLNNWAL